MFISDYMTAKPITISEDLTLPEARQILVEHTFRHLPVVDGDNRLIGVISDRDLRSAYPSTILSEEERKQALDDALMVFERDKVGALPVVTDDDEVIGIFSMRDLTAAYKKLFGAAEKGSVLIAIFNDGKEGSLGHIVSLLEENDFQCSRLVNIGSMSGFERIYLRVNTAVAADVQTLLQEHGLTLLKP